MKKHYHRYKEYHTSQDSYPDLVTDKSLLESLRFYEALVNLIEETKVPTVTKPCEPHMAKYDLYPDFGLGKVDVETSQLMDVISFCDGRHAAFEISKRLEINKEKLEDIFKILEKNKIIEMKY